MRTHTHSAHARTQHSFTAHPFRTTPTHPSALQRSASFSGSVADMLAVLVVCEWSYLTWGEAAQASRGSELPFWLGEWIDLHSGTYFNEVVAYLRGLLDKIGETLEDDDKQRVRQVFLRAVQLEVCS